MMSTNKSAVLAQMMLTKVPSTRVITHLLRTASMPELRSNSGLLNSAAGASGRCSAFFS